METALSPKAALLRMLKVTHESGSGKESKNRTSGYKLANPTTQRVERLRGLIRECYMRALRIKDQKVLAWMTQGGILKLLPATQTRDLCKQLLIHAKQNQAEEEKEEGIVNGIYRLLRETPAAISRRDETGMNLILECAVYDSPKTLQYIVRELSIKKTDGPSVQTVLNHYSDKDGNTVSHIAAQQGSYRVMEWLASNAKGVLVQKNKEGLTALDLLNARAHKKDSQAIDCLHTLAAEKCMEGAKIAKKSKKNNRPNMLPMEGEEGHDSQKKKTAPKKQKQDSPEQTP